MRMRVWLLCLAVATIASPAFAQEPQISLTVPIVPAAPPTVDKYLVDEFRVHPSTPTNVHPSIDVVLYAPDGSRLVFHYPDSSVAAYDTDAEVATLIDQLNTSNNTTTPLRKRILQHVCADFPAKFPGGCSVP